MPRHSTEGVGAWTSLARCLLEFQLETPDTMLPRWLQGSGAHTTWEELGAPGSVPSWHPHHCANLLPHACVASLLLPAVILRLYSKLLKLTYI